LVAAFGRDPRQTRPSLRGRAPTARGLAAIGGAVEHSLELAEGRNDRATYRRPLSFTCSLRTRQRSASIDMVRNTNVGLAVRCSKNLKSSSLDMI
jgi:hypothetical protein